MTPRQWATCARNAYEAHDRPAFEQALSHLIDAAEREHPIVTDVLTRTPPERQPIEPSDPE